jgi:hypothetical protein
MQRRGRLEAIKPGRQFRPLVAGIMVSTARVLTIGPDAYGIPHVHFEITLAVPSGRNVVQEIRVLSLESFAQLYPEPVAPEAVAEPMVPEAIAV